MAPFEIIVGYVGDSVVRLDIEGEIDLSTAPQLLDSVAHAAAAFDRRNIVVDLRDVSFIDSSGLSAILQADRVAREADAHLIVCSPSRMVRGLFEMTGLDGLVDIRPGWAVRGLARQSLN